MKKGTEPGHDRKKIQDSSRGAPGRIKAEREENYGNERGNRDV